MSTNEQDSALAALRHRFETEKDFINVKRLGYSLRRCEERYPEGLPDAAVASAVCLSEKEVDFEMDRIADELRDIMSVEVDKTKRNRATLWLMLAVILPGAG